MLLYTFRHNGQALPNILYQGISKVPKDIKNGVFCMTKEMAIVLKGLKGVFLTQEGKDLLDIILKENVKNKAI
ncbi:hypothetical protein PMEGAPL125_52050 [Priestia megaterium]